MKVTVDGIAADGKPTHNEWTGKFDGKDYPITGDPVSDTRAYKPVNDHTLGLAEKKAGTITNTGRVVVSADGKTRTSPSTQLMLTAKRRTSSLSTTRSSGQICSTPKGRGNPRPHLFEMKVAAE